MERTLRGPRRGSAAYQALEQMILAGGSATRTQLASGLLSHFRSASRFEQLVVEPLVDNRMARWRSEDELEITLAGRAHVDAALAEPIPPKKSGKPVPPRTAPEFKPLRPERYALMQETRPGALDYRKYPSLMGGERVPYRGQR